MRSSGVVWIALAVVMATVNCLVADEPKAGEEIELEGSDLGKLKLCWIPGGVFTMGSPKVERDYAVYV
jgi:hypothetical protein